MPLIKRNRVLAAKIETTPGTAVSLSGTDGAFNVYNVSVQYDVPMTARQMQGSFTNFASVPGARSAKVTFSLDHYGSGSAGTPPAWATTFLPACGFVLGTGGTYAPVSTFSSMKALSMGVYEDGLLKQIKGAMGTFKIECEDGKPVRFDFEFTGVYTSVTDVAVIAPTYPTRVPPSFQGATLTVGAYTPIISKLSIDAANVVSLRQDVTSSSGYISAMINDHAFTGSMDAEAALVATYDAFGNWIGGTTAALSCVVGATGDTLTIAAPMLQLTNVQEADRDGTVIHDLQFALVGNTANSEITLDF